MKKNIKTLNDITKEDFREWLLSYDKNHVISEGWTSCDCPLAVFISETFGVTNLNNIRVLPKVFGAEGVGTWVFAKDGLTSTGEMPPWASEFANLADHYLGKITRKSEFMITYITSGGCLEILERV